MRKVKCLLVVFPHCVFSPCVFSQLCIFTLCIFLPAGLSGHSILNHSLQQSLSLNAAVKSTGFQITKRSILLRYILYISVSDYNYDLKDYSVCVSVEFPHRAIGQGHICSLLTCWIQNHYSFHVLRLFSHLLYQGLSNPVLRNESFHTVREACQLEKGMPVRENVSNQNNPQSQSWKEFLQIPQGSVRQNFLQ